MSSTHNSPNCREGDSLNPASSPVRQYGTFPAPAAATASIDRVFSGPQAAVDDGGSDGGTNSYDDTEQCLPADRPTAPRPLFGYLFTVLVAASIIALFALAAWLYPHQPPSPSPPLSPIPPVKLLIVGDSITQGAEGDYTWRYRLWEWLRDSPDHTNVVFVGPYSGTFPPPDSPAPPQPQPPPATPGLETRAWGGYARDVDRLFLAGDGGKAHFAGWGRQAAQFRYLIADVVAEYQPDYVLVALGFNDLAWWVSGPDGTIESMRGLIGSARGAKGDVGFAVANVPHRTAVAGREDLPAMTDEYNALLEVVVGELTSAESPVHLVRLREAYSCEVSGCPASHDGLHPNALGEFQIARAFSQVLYEKYGLGSANFSIPATIPPRPCGAPENVGVVRPLTEYSMQPIRVAWDGFYGAFGYFVQARRKGWDWGGDLFTDIRQYQMFWPGSGQEWEVRVKSYCGDQQDHSPWSDVVSVRT